MKKAIPYIAGAVIALGSYLTLGTPIGEAIQIAFDQEAALQACQQLLERSE